MKPIPVPVVKSLEFLEQSRDQVVSQIAALGDFVADRSQPPNALAASRTAIAIIPTIQVMAQTCVLLTKSMARLLPSLYPILKPCEWLNARLLNSASWKVYTRSLSLSTPRSVRFSQSKRARHHKRKKAADTIHQEMGLGKERYDPNDFRTKDLASSAGVLQGGSENWGIVRDNNGWPG